jgi:hypothetical protein
MTVGQHMTMQSSVELGSFAAEKGRVDHFDDTAKKNTARTIAGKCRLRKAEGYYLLAGASARQNLSDPVIINEFIPPEIQRHLDRNRTPPELFAEL